MRRLEDKHGVRAGGLRRCAVCIDGTKTSGLVFRVEGAASVEPAPLPVCAGYGVATRWSSTLWLRTGVPWRRDWGIAFPLEAREKNTATTYSSLTLRSCRSSKIGLARYRPDTSVSPALNRCRIQMLRFDRRSSSA